MPRALAALLLWVLGLLCPGISVGALMMFIAWQHNPQGEFHEGRVIHWQALLTVGVGWCLVVTAVVAIGAWLWLTLAKLLNR